jgi:Uma2 family endonuclease
MRAATMQPLKSVTRLKPVRPAVPVLVNGDHLALPEFERRYEALPGDQQAELIEGIVLMTPPVSNLHGEAHGALAYFLKRYAQATPGVACGVNTSIRLDGRNEYQPDALLRIDSARLGRTKVAADGLLEGGPELVSEIAFSTAGYDLHEKKEAYQRNSVAEYLVWRLADCRIVWFALEQGEYTELKPRPDGIVRSRVFPGLWLNLPALAVGDETKVSRSLEKGLLHPEHAAFVKRLRQSK